VASLVICPASLARANAAETTLRAPPSAFSDAKAGGSTVPAGRVRYAHGDADEAAPQLIVLCKEAWSMRMDQSMRPAA
jgi:hypothetical protein